MSFRHAPADCLEDMLEYIGRIEAYTDGFDLASFEWDRRTQDTVERCLERICEAGFRLRERAAELMPDQPWSEIRGMGNRLRHGYDGINVEIVWRTVQTRLAELKLAAERALQGLKRTTDGGANL